LNIHHDCLKKGLLNTNYTPITPYMQITGASKSVVYILNIKTCDPLVSCFTVQRPSFLHHWGRDRSSNIDLQQCSCQCNNSSYYI